MSLPVAVVGATGYTGAELLRFLHGHPRVDIKEIVGQTRAGRPIAEVLPSLSGVFDGDVAPFDAARISAVCEVAFCALPHGKSAPIVSELRAKGVVVFDLSADFRLSNRETYESWYGAHGAPDLFGTAAYGLVELHREAVATADLIAVPGCYPTASILALAPLLHKDLVQPLGIVVDAKSGTSGAGRTPVLGTHMPEVSEGIRAYKSAGRHRHTPEIEQELARLAGTDLRIVFTPHLVPMTRGILATAYAVAQDGVTTERCTEAAHELYDSSPFVTIMPGGQHPDTHWVRGSNRAMVSYAKDERTGHIIAQCAIDNLAKGAAGQAVQCLNVRFGWPEDEGLEALPMWP